MQNVHLLQIVDMILFRVLQGLVLRRWCKLLDDRDRAGTLFNCRHTALVFIFLLFLSLILMFFKILFLLSL